MANSLQPQVTVATFRDEHFACVDALWREAFPNDPPWNAAAASVPEKVRFQPDLLLVGLVGDEVIGSVMAGYDGHRGWVSRIAVASAVRRRGIGRLLLEEAERRLAALGCRKINLQIAQSNASVTEFYRRAGFDIEPRISMSRLIAPARAG